MFENGSLLRRRKRFKLHKGEKDSLNAELQALASFNRAFLARQAGGPPAGSMGGEGLYGPPVSMCSRVSPERPEATDTAALLPAGRRPRRAFTIAALLEPEPRSPSPPPRAPRCPLPLPPPPSYLLAAQRYHAELLAGLQQSCLPPLWTWRDTSQFSHYTLNS